jgi:hypothetical protein
MTLARVTPDYPTDAVVQKSKGHRFGVHRLCQFQFLTRESPSERRGETATVERRARRDAETGDARDRSL